MFDPLSEFNAPDLPIVKLVERCMMRFQGWTRIPQWRVVSTCWCLYGALIVWRVIDKRGWMFWFSFAMGTFMVLLWTLPIQSVRQRLADEYEMPVQNPVATTSIGFAVRIFITVTSLFVIVCPPLHWTDSAKGVLMIAAIYIDAGDTWPNKGPKLRDRLKKLFTFHAPLTPARVRQ